MNNKKAAMEMSVGTIVTIVLLMTVLILGLVLVQSIFSSAKYNIEIIDQKVRGEINKLFSEDQRIVVYLPNQKVSIKQGKEWGVAWAVKNLERGVSETSKLTYEIVVSDLSGCGGLTDQKALSYVGPGQKETKGIPLPPGQSNYEISRINIPEIAPLCTIRYRINTKLDDQEYSSSFFDVKIEA